MVKRCISLRYVVAVMMLSGSILQSASAFPVIPDIFRKNQIEKLGQRKSVNEAAVAGSQNTSGRTNGSASIPQATTNEGCKGVDCEESQVDVSDLGVNDSSVAVTSPYGHVFDTMYSQKTTAMLRDNGVPLSPLSLASTTWQSSSSAVAAGLQRAFELSMHMANLRYNADQTLQQVLNGSGAEGQRVWEAYQGCTSRLTQKGVSLGAAQEACFNQWNRDTAPSAGQLLAMENINVAQDSMSLQQHPRHPLFKNQLRDNASVLGAYFPNAAPNKIRLTHFIFSFPLLQAQGDAAQKQKVVSLLSGWKEIFGDVEIEETNSAQPQNAFRGQKTSVIKPTFDYRYAMLGIPNAGDPFSSGAGVVSPFKQWVRFNQDFIYFRIMDVMAKYCKYKVGTTTSGTPGAVDNSVFWAVSADGNGGKSLSRQDVTDISMPFEDFGKIQGEIVYKYFSGLTAREGETMEYCEELDPRSGQSMTSLKKLLEYETNSNVYYATPVRTVHQLAWSIAAARITEVFKQTIGLVMDLTGGKREDDARMAAIDLMERALEGQFDYQSGMQASAAAYYGFLDAAKREGDALAREAK